MVYNCFAPEMVLFILWNLTGFTMVLLDKRRARRNEWRIKERTFFLWALIFGAVGILIGMYVFRHKTRHWSFSVGIPIICIVNLVCGYVLWRQGFLG
ncbi:MAG: hypothetical protein H6Q66_810 [Firmicutes bacterium]|nr:hypothetical protein [Bacillota bacterium]